jgi:hypothetical protein
MKLMRGLGLEGLQLEVQLGFLKRVMEGELEMEQFEKSLNKGLLLRIKI